MSNRTILDGYLPMAAFIYQSFAGAAEVVLHDTSHLDNSIIAIHNGALTGRRVGGPISSLGLRLIHDQVYRFHSHVTRDVHLTAQNLLLRSSAYFILDSDRELVGMLCINLELARLAGLALLQPEPPPHLAG